MQVFATFEYSPFLELAISELKVKGITDIYAVPLDLREEEAKVMDTIHHADGMSFVDKGFILAFMFATVGASKGFVWRWGPVIWGIIGAVAGFVLGVLVSWGLYLYKRRKKRARTARGEKGDVILVVNCEQGQAGAVKTILWDHHAKGVAVTR